MKGSSEYNQELLKSCDLDADREHYRKDATIAELYAADKAALLALPAVPLDVSKYLRVNTNGYGRFYLSDGLHEYSVSPQYAESRIMVKITASEVIPLDKDQQPIVRHSRLYGDFRQQSMQWLPYLTQLSRSPNALKYTGIYPMLPQSIKDYLDRCERSDKGQILRVIATLTAKNGFESALQTVASGFKVRGHRYRQPDQPAQPDLRAGPGAGPHASGRQYSRADEGHAQFSGL